MTKPPDQTNLRIRSYQPGDEEAINEMFSEVFNQSRSMSHWYWKYRDNPFGAHIISLAFHGRTLAAHYGGYPVVFYKGDSGAEPHREFLTYHLGDKMTRQAFRSLGFGKTSVLARTFRHFRETFGSDVPFGYGFGAGHSLRFGLLFLGYIDIEEVTCWRMSMQNLSEISLPFLDRLFLKTEEVFEFSDEYTRFFYAVAPGYRYLVKRDAVYLNWRYLKRPDRKYLILSVRNRLGRLRGWSVFFREGETIIWGDALFTPGKTVYPLAVLKALYENPYSRGMKFLEGWFPDRPEWWKNFLIKTGFTASREPNSLHLTGPTFRYPELQHLMKGNFYYTKGDSDLF